MGLQEIIRKLTRINKVCKKAKYSLDTSNELEYLSKELHKQAILIQECCY